MSYTDEYDYLFKLIIVGDSNVGKTNIMSKYIKDQFNINSKSTIGVEFGTKILTIDNKKIKAQIWDTAGQERYKSITSAYYKGAKGAFIVYDITNKFSFDSVDKWVQDLNSYGDKNLTLLLIACSIIKLRLPTIKIVLLSISTSLAKVSC